MNHSKGVTRAQTLLAPVKTLAAMQRYHKLVQISSLQEKFFNLLLMKWLLLILSFPTHDLQFKQNGANENFTTQMVLVKTLPLSRNCTLLFHLWQHCCNRKFTAPSFVICCLNCSAYLSTAPTIHLSNSPFHTIVSAFSNATCRAFFSCISKSLGKK